MKYFLMIWASLSIGMMHAQQPCDITITGHVVDEHSDDGLGFADVFLITQQIGVSTNEHGAFTMSNLCSGEIQIRVSHVGCVPDTFTIVLQKDTHVHFVLEHHIELLQLVEIEAKQPHHDISSIDRVNIEAMQTMSSVSLSQALDNVAGVQMLSNGGNISKPVIHGMHSNRLVVMNQNTKLEGQQWGGEHAPEIDPMAAEEILVVKGASALRYGPEALAGVIINKGIKLESVRGIHGRVQLNGASNGKRGLATGKVYGQLLDSLPIYFSLQGTMSRGGDLSAPNYILRNTGSFDRNFDARLAWLKTKYGAEFHYALINSDLGILSYSHIGNLTDLENAINSGTPYGATDLFSYAINHPRQHVLHELTSGQFWFKPNFSGKITLNASRQYNLRQEYDKSTFSSDSVADLQYEITTYQSDLVYEQRISARYKFEIGAAGSTQANTYTGRFFIPNFRNYQGGVFTVHHLQFEKLEIEAGARYDYKWQQAFMYRNDTIYKPIRTFSGLSWNLGANYSYRKLEFSLIAGRAWRAPSINELYSAGLHHGAAAVEYGDEQLKEERAYSATFEVKTNRMKLFGNDIGISASTYSYWFDQFIYLVPTEPATLTIRGAFPTFEYRAVQAWFRGIDANVVYSIFRFEINAKAELVRANDLNSGAYLLGIPSDRYDLALEYYISKGKRPLSVGANGSRVLTQKRFPVGIDYANPPKGYTLFNAFIDGKLPLKKQQFFYHLEVKNILNTAYRNYLNRLRYFADEPGRSFNISIGYTF